MLLPGLPQEHIIALGHGCNSSAFLMGEAVSEAVSKRFGGIQTAANLVATTAHGARQSVMRDFPEANLIIEMLRVGGDLSLAGVWVDDSPIESVGGNPRWVQLSTYNFLTAKHEIAPEVNGLWQRLVALKKQYYR